MEKTIMGQHPIAYADEIALMSQDRSRRAGCFIINIDGLIISTGYNQLSKGFDVDDDKNHERPIKYKLFLHAEAYAITRAARNGISLLDTTMYLNWFPCSNCALMIVASGIIELHCDEEPDWDSGDRWLEDQMIAIDILEKGGVKVAYHNYKVKNRNVNES